MNDNGQNHKEMADDDQVEPVALRLQCVTYDERGTVLPTLTEAIDRAGGWLLDRRTVAAHALELHIELQVRALVDVYAALVSSGVELTREAHLLLTERCVCRQHQPTRDSMASIMAIRLEVVFLVDMTVETTWTQWISRSAATA